MIVQQAIDRSHFPEGNRNPNFDARPFLTAQRPASRAAIGSQQAARAQQGSAEVADDSDNKVVSYSQIWCMAVLNQAAVCCSSTNSLGV